MHSNRRARKSCGKPKYGNLAHVGGPRLIHKKMAQKGWCDLESLRKSSLRARECRAIGGRSRPLWRIARPADLNTASGNVVAVAATVHQDGADCTARWPRMIARSAQISSLSNSARFSQSESVPRTRTNSARPRSMAVVTKASSIGNVSEP